MGTVALRLRQQWIAAIFAVALLGLTCRAGAASCTPSANGLIGWWSGDSNAGDLTGANNGVLQGGATAGAAGFDGGAFSFDGTNSYAQIPDSQALRPTNFTVEAWVRFNSLDSAGLGGSPAGDQYIVFKQNSRTSDFEGFDLSKTRIAGGDVFRFIVASQLAQSVEIQSATFINTNVWYHIAVVRGTNFTQLYVNGVLERQATVTFPQDYGNFPLYFGTSGESYWDHKLSGLLDEAAIYSRALSAAEISAIYAAGSSGKCKGVTITAQPQSQSVAAGGSAYFSAVADGFGTLSYQWQFDGGSIAGATGTDLTLTNIQPGNAGNYAVVASNFSGAVTSAVAVLTVSTPNSCTPPGIGLLGWWPGDGTPNDVAGGNNGLLLGGASASAPGLDGSAFSFDGTNGYVQIPDSPALRPTNFTVEAWVRFSSLDSAGSGGSPAGDQYIVFKQNTRASDFEGIDVGKTRIGGSDYFQFIVSSASGQSAHIESVTAVGAGVWYHVAATRDPNSIRLYVNGQLETQTSITFPQDYGNFPVLFGTSGQSYWDHKFKGTLDEVSLYDHALSPVEIAAIYSSGTSGKCKGASITAQPQSQSVAIGGSALFTVSAAGIEPIRYQWQFNGLNLPNATSTTLPLSNVQLSNGGNYAVIVTNTLGAATSAVAVLTVLVPPTITVQPQSRTNVAGTPATFSVSASGSGLLSYQWQFNGGNIPGATDINLTLTAVQPTDAGNYTVTVTNSAGAITSRIAVLTVLASPAITSQPQSRTNVVGTSAAFSVTANGAAPLTYQWQFNGANIGGATGSNLTLANVQPSDAGNYLVVVTNAAGSVTSAVAVLTVWLPPTITAQPQSRTNLLGTTATFGASASGTAPLSYQWQLNGANIPNATGTSLLLSNVQISDAGSYTLVVTNVAGSATSAIAVLTVWAAPSITAQPQSRTNVAGTSAAFSTIATGTAPLSYQWQLNGANNAGATGSSLTLANVQASDAGNYSVVVTNVAGSVTSAVAVLTVVIPPAITAPPQSQTNVAGTTANFSVTAIGTGPLTYQWQFNGGNMAGATTTSVTLNNVQSTNAGSYAVVVTNAAGSVTSALATLTVWVPPGITAQPQNRTNVLATTATFSVAASGTTPLSYQWQFNGANIASAANPLLTLTNIQVSDAGGYSVVVTNVAGAITSSVASLTVLVPPTITAQPQNSTNAIGTTTIFSGNASGTTPLSYQWQFNGASLPDATAMPLMLSNVQPGNAGNYSVIVTNIAGAATSAVATLTIIAPPSITVQPQSHTNVAYVTTALGAAASGTPPLTYQWRFNGRNIPNATGPNLILTNPQPTDAGSYTLVVTNSAGAVTSAVATLTVITPTDCVPAPPGLVGWWAGEGNANDLAGTNSGVLQGGANASAVGVVGSGINFDGANGSVQIPDSPALKPTNLTVMCWVRFDSLDSAGNTPSAGQQFLIFKQNSRTNNFEGFLLSKERELAGDVFSWDVTSAAGQPVRVESGTTIIPNVWYHVVAVRGPDFAQLYINGQLEAFTNVSFPQDYGNLPLYFGSSGQPSFDRKLSGILDEVCLFSRALNSSEIAADYFAGQSGKCKAPKILTQPANITAYWGSSIAFTSTAAGVLPLRYQWRKDGSVLSRATNSFFALSNVQLSDAGSYAFQVTNSFGVTNSAPAVLKVSVADVAIQKSLTGTQNATALTISGTPGRLYGIQASSSLGLSSYWIGLTNIFLTPPPATVWFDPQSTQFSRRFYRVVPGPIGITSGAWETSDIGIVWSDDFSGATLGSNWIVLGNANVSITNNELQFAQADTDYSRQIYYQPWLTSSDGWTIRWTQRFGALNAASFGLGVGVKNFQAGGGNDRGYNGLLLGAGPSLGQMQISRFDNLSQQPAAPGNPIALTAGDIVDCSFSRSGWTMTATASNRANAQVSTSTLTFNDASNLIAPTISRICFYPLGGTVYVDNISFSLDHRKPARFIIVGASASDGYNATKPQRRYISVVQSNFFETICNDSSSFNTASNSVSLLPEILAHQPSTAILMIAGNDLAFGYPASQWQTQYSNLVVQLQANGVAVKHTFQTPRNSIDLAPLRNWIIAHYPASDIIDTWTPFVTNGYALKPIYDSGDGVHPNDAGHLLLGQIIRTNLP